MEQVKPADFSEIRWRGSWIGAAEEQISLGSMLPGTDAPKASPGMGLFRRVVTLASVPARAPARMTADSRYILYVNGVEVCRGPVRSQPRRMRYDLVDLAPYLRAGENTLAACVKFYGAANSFYIPAVPNGELGHCGVFVFEADLGPAGWVVSDAAWKGSKSAAWQFGPAGADPISGGVPVEVLDARGLPAGWQAPGFDDGAWGAARPLRAIHIGGFARSQPPVDPYGPLYPRSIAFLGGALARPASVSVEVLPSLPDFADFQPAARVSASMALAGAPVGGKGALPLTAHIPAGGALRLQVDMGRIVSGLVHLDLQAAAGTTVEMCYVETPLTGKETGMFGPHNGSRYIARGADDAFETFDSNGLRYITALVYGGPAVTLDLAVREHIYPWQPGAAFACSDDELNRIYTAGIRTVNLNSHDAFMDCPTREQRAWVGDSVVHQMVHLAANTDWRLAWHYLDLAASPRPDGILPMSVAGEIEAGESMTIPDWSLHWVHGVFNLYRFSGDREKVKEFMPVVERVLRWYMPFQTAAGVLKDVTEWNLVDWAALFVEDCSALLTALWARGLREFAEMAAWLEEKASQRWAEGLYARAQSGFEMFWDAQRGTYVDHVKNGVRQPAISQVAGAAAIAAGLAPRERWAGILAVITDPARLVVRSWTGAGGDYDMEKMQKQFMGIYEADWDAEREVVIGEPFISYLVHDAVAQAGEADRLPGLYRRWSTFLQDGYDTIGECWGWGTHVHGWSCTPTRDMVFYTLGVTPLEPGYTAARIAPRLGGLAWARGSVPTPFGLIEVAVEGGRVRVNSPVPFVVELPGQAPRSFAAGAAEV